MSPYDHWKTTDFDGERRAKVGEWIDNRANELMDDPDFLERVTEHDIIDHVPIVELVSDVIALHRVHPDKLLNSSVLTRLYAHAKQHHQQAMDAAIGQAQYEFDYL